MTIFFGDKISLCSQAGLKLTILLSQPLDCWDQRHAPLCLAPDNNLLTQKLILLYDEQRWLSPFSLKVLQTTSEVLYLSPSHSRQPLMFRACHVLKSLQIRRTHQIVMRCKLDFTASRSCKTQEIQTKGAKPIFSYQGLHTFPSS